MTVSGYWLEGRRDLSFTYDADGLRQTKTSHAGTTTFGWDHASGLPLLLEENGPEGRTRYLYGPGGVPIAQQNPDGRTLYLHADQLGSIRAVTAATVATTTFDPWGIPQTTGEPTATPFGYAGQYTDIETGLVYMRARYYDPTTGTFLTRRPVFVANIRDGRGALRYSGQIWARNPAIMRTAGYSNHLIQGCL